MKNNVKAGIFCLAILVCQSSMTLAQDTVLTPLEFKDMAEFNEQSGNWFIVGDVWMDPAVDVSHTPEPGSSNKRKGKKQKQEDIPQAVHYQEGTGILLNINDATRKSNLVSNWEHGDIYLEMEVMVPKGSNSGLYLQGRYEIQLEDSWGIANPKFSNMGGIYRNWEEAPEKSYMGKAPLANAAKAPGLWQKLAVSFQAPKFDASGKKISNARIISADLNGVRIHDNVEIPLPTGGPIENNEVAKGPIMIQGDHGPIAVRGMKYRHMRLSEVELSDLEYSFFPGNFEDIDDFSQKKPTKTGKSEILTYEVDDVEQLFGLIYKGRISIPEDNDYTFRLAAGGDARLYVNGEKITEGGGRIGTGSINLEKGSYPIEIFYNRNITWVAPKLGVFVESPGTYSKPLHAYTSFPQYEEVPSAILVRPAHGTKLLRAFLDFKGDRRKRLTHTIAVGEQGKAHYIYDLQGGNLVCVWRGDFIDATPMWNSRGDGSFRPLGLVQYLISQPSLAILENENEAFPEQSNEEDFRGKGYELEEATGRPVFKYLYKGTEVEDKIYPGENNGMVTREIAFKNIEGNQKLHLKIAEGESISQMPNGDYEIGDKQFYLKVSSSAKPIVRQQGEKSELILPIDGNPVKYSIIW